MLVITKVINDFIIEITSYGGIEIKLLEKFLSHT